MLRFQLKRKRGVSSYRRGIGGRIAVNLIAAQDDQVGLLLIQHLGEEIKRPGIGLAFASLVAVGNSLSALAHAGAEVQVSHLHNLKPSVVGDPRLRLLQLVMRASLDSQVGAEEIRAGIEM